MKVVNSLFQVVCYFYPNILTNISCETKVLLIVVLHAPSIKTEKPEKF